MRRTSPASWLGSNSARACFWRSTRRKRTGTFMSLSRCPRESLCKPCSSIHALGPQGHFRCAEGRPIGQPTGKPATESDKHALKLKRIVENRKLSERVRHSRQRTARNLTPALNVAARPWPVVDEQLLSTNKRTKAAFQRPCFAADVNGVG